MAGAGHLPDLHAAAAGVAVARATRGSPRGRRRRRRGAPGAARCAGIIPDQRPGRLHAGDRRAPTASAATVIARCQRPCAATASLRVDGAGGAVGDDGGQAPVVGGGLEHDLAAEREAEAGDPAGLARRGAARGSRGPLRGPAGRCRPGRWSGPRSRRCRGCRARARRSRGARACGRGRAGGRGCRRSRGSPARPRRCARGRTTPRACGRRRGRSGPPRAGSPSADSWISQRGAWVIRLAPTEAASRRRTRRPRRRRASRRRARRASRARSAGARAAARRRR